jgi:probable HAF family extracellular repeat protein
VSLATIRPAVITLLALLSLSIPYLGAAQIISYRVIPLTSPFDPAGRISGGGHHFNNYRYLPLTDHLAGRSPQAFVWKWDKPLPLTLFDGSCGEAIGINAPGHIVGAACVPGETGLHAFLFRNKRAIDLGTFGGTGAGADVVNRTDQIAGVYDLADGSIHAYFWAKKNWTEIPSLGGSRTYTFGINSSGVVTGQSDVSNDLDPILLTPPVHGYQWSNGVVTDFGQIFGSNFNYGNGINDAGVIVGAADLIGDTAAHAFLWNQGSVEDITPYDNIVAWGIGINNNNEVVGSWGTFDGFLSDGPPIYTMACPCLAFLWQNGSLFFLNDLVPAGWNLSAASSINERGDIVAQGQFNGGPFQLLLLKQIAPLAAPQHAASPKGLPRYPLTGPRALRRVGRNEIVAVQ